MLYPSVPRIHSTESRRRAIARKRSPYPRYVHFGVNLSSFVASMGHTPCCVHFGVIPSFLVASLGHIPSWYTRFGLILSYSVPDLELQDIVRERNPSSCSRDLFHPPKFWSRRSNADSEKEKTSLIQEASMLHLRLGKTPNALSPDSFCPVFRPLPKSRCSLSPTPTGGVGR